MTCAEAVWPPAEVDDAPDVAAVPLVVEDPDVPDVPGVDWPPPPAAANPRSDDATDLLDVAFEDPLDAATRAPTSTAATSTTAPDTIHQRKRVHTDALAVSHEEGSTMCCLSDAPLPETKLKEY